MLRKRNRSSLTPRLFIILRLFIVFYFLYIKSFKHILTLLICAQNYWSAFYFIWTFNLYFDFWLSPGSKETKCWFMRGHSNNFIVRQIVCFDFTCSSSNVFLNNIKLCLACVIYLTWSFSEFICCRCSMGTTQCHRYDCMRVLYFRSFYATSPEE